MAVIVAALLTAGLPGGCAWSRGGPPAWIEGASRDYPSDQYLTGVGQAESQPAAAERAYAAVARIFKAEVSAQSRDWESFLLLEKRSNTQTERRLTLDQVTRVSTDKVLENVRILDGWFDQRTGRHYALAGMNRAQAGMAMQERIAELDGMVEAGLQGSRQAQDKLDRLRNIRRAVKSLVLREAYNADLRIIRQSGQGIEAVYRVADLTAEMERFVTANVTISVEVTGEQAEPVRRAVTEGLIREGLPVSSHHAGVAADPTTPIGPDGAEGGPKPLALLVKGTVRLWRANVPDPQFRYIRWCSDFVIVETGTQRVVGAVSRSGKEGHLTEGEAQAKAIRVMQQEVTSELAKSLAGYVYGDMDQPDAILPAACPRAEGAAPTPFS
jgi:hypothetical protein